MRNEKNRLAEMLRDAGVSFDIGLTSPTCLIVTGPDGRSWTVYETNMFDLDSHDAVIECTLVTTCNAENAMKIITESAKLRRFIDLKETCWKYVGSCGECPYNGVDDEHDDCNCMVREKVNLLARELEIETDE